MTDQLFHDVAEGLVPPDMRPKTPRARYDTTVSLCLAGTIIVGGLHIAQACGFLTWLGLGGFAMANDLTTQQITLQQIQLSSLNRDLRDAKREVCKAQQLRNAAALDSWSGQLQSYRGQYYAITKSWPQVQSCEELLVNVSANNP
jgi:hypothetical protein